MNKADKMFHHTAYNDATKTLGSEESVIHNLQLAHQKLYTAYLPICQREGRPTSLTYR